MDVNTLRSLTTVLSFVVFLGIMVWACSSRRKGDFEEAAKLPFEQD